MFTERMGRLLIVLVDCNVASLSSGNEYFRWSACLKASGVTAKSLTLCAVAETRARCKLGYVSSLQPSPTTALQLRGWTKQELFIHPRNMQLEGDTRTAYFHYLAYFPPRERARTHTHKSTLWCFHLLSSPQDYYFLLCREIYGTHLLSEESSTSLECKHCILRWTYKFNKVIKKKWCLVSSIFFFSRSCLCTTPQTRNVIVAGISFFYLPLVFFSNSHQPVIQERANTISLY